MNDEAKLASQHESANRDAAKSAGLRYVSDNKPGIRRAGSAADGFRYLDPNDREIADEAVLDRIRKIGIPPAYAHVWICPHANGHLQATGRDAKNRKQYRYHARWRETRDENKYDRMMAFGDALPALRARIAEDMTRRGLPREKVLATVVRLLETTRIRVGNEEYAEANRHYGLTTLRNRHVSVEGGTLHFSFVGKSGVRHRLELKSRKLAKIVQNVRDLPGQELFQYVDAETGEIRPVHSEDVNEYLQEITGESFTAKDFRTWSGTVLCAMELAGFENAATASAVKENVARAIKTVASHLGNTPSVCRKCYIHPAVLDTYTRDGFPESLRVTPSADADTIPDALLPEEHAVLQFLRGQTQVGQSAHG
ncbi:MAG: DNA topoisomerase IB [Akkermansiaceae bacterium]|nr:DNA topoisomerase IB [Armatimonadota bacterium]